MGDPPRALRDFVAYLQATNQPYEEHKDDISTSIRLLGSPVAIVFIFDSKSGEYRTTEILEC